MTVEIGIKRLRVKKLHTAMLAGGLEQSGQRNAGDPTFGPHPPLTNPPAAGGAGGADGLFTHTPPRVPNKLLYAPTKRL